MLGLNNPCRNACVASSVSDNRIKKKKKNNFSRFFEFISLTGRDVLVIFNFNNALKYFWKFELFHLSIESNGPVKFSLLVMLHKTYTCLGRSVEKQAEDEQ